MGIFSDRIFIKKMSADRKLLVMSKNYRTKDDNDDLSDFSQIASQAAFSSGSTKIFRAGEANAGSGANSFGTAESGILHSDVALSDDAQEFSLRPKSLEEFLGQKEIKENLSVFIKAARERQEPLDHLFLIGPPGLGKTTLAEITAHELGADFKVTSAPALDKPKDLAGILSTITPRTVFFFF